MATLPVYNSVPDVRGYVSTRVFDGVRKFDSVAAERHRDRVKAALDRFK